MTKYVRIENADLGTDKIVEIKIFRVMPGEPDVLERVETITVWRVIEPKVKRTR